MNLRKGFASDNNSGVHEKIIEALIHANQGHVKAYGDDEYIKSAMNRFKKVFGEDIDIYFVFSGTGANVMGLSAITSSYNSIICSEWAHINVDETGAPEKFIGCKLITLPSKEGKIKVEDIKSKLHVVGEMHHSQPKVISITQATEFGTVYTVDEIKELADFAHQNNMLLHMDGARIANAAAYLNVSLKEMTNDTGVDVLSFGGTKNGMMFGEAVIFFNKEISKEFIYLRKNGMQLASKMRYISAQFDAILKDDLWLLNAKHSNEMAKLLVSEIENIEGISLTQKVQANEIFAIIPKSIISKLQKKYFFYMWNEEKCEARWVTSFDTTKEDVFSFANEIKRLMGNKL